MKTIYWKLAPRFKRWLIRILKRFSLIERLNFTWSFSINGVPCQIPIIRGTGDQNVFMTEMWMVEVLKRLLKIKSGIFIDVGANIGQTLLKLRAVSKSMPYLGFEPNPTCASYVLDLIRSNNFHQTRIIPIGLSDSRGLLDLIYYAADNRVDSGASLVADPKFRPNHPVVFRQPVPVLPFEDVIPYLDGLKLGVIKIDVEGGELDVLKSMEKIIRADHPLILLEILCMGDDLSTLSKNQLLESFFREIDYCLIRIKKAGDRFDKFIPIEAIGENTDPTEWDYVAVPTKLASTLLAAD